MTREFTVQQRVAIADQQAAVDALNAAGLYATIYPRPTNDPNLPDDRALVEVRSLVGEDPDGDRRQEILTAVAEVLRSAGIETENHSNGVTIAGGSVNHRWTEVLLDGHPTGRKILAGPDQDVDAELDEIADTFRVPRSALTIEAVDDPPNS